MSRAALISRLFAEGTLAAVAIAIGVEMAVRTTHLPDTTRAQLRSQVVTASSGEILWTFLAADDKWRLSAQRADIDPRYLAMLIAYEDKRFRHHRGVDVVALMRAGMQAVVHRRSVSGGSTLTMQVVRMLEPGPRTVAAKIDQIFKALKLERTLAKEDILHLYLRIAPFGGNIEGVRAAALAYFGKDPKHLSLAQAAQLVALPQFPEARRPDRHLAAAQAARNRVLSRLAARGVIDARSAMGAMREPASTGPRSLTRSAPHLAMRLRQANSDPSKETIATLLDADLQRHVEAIASRVITSWSDAVNIGVIVLRNRDASVAAYLGGADLTAESRKGFVDLVSAVRSPGSALKPLIYAMAFEKLIVHPETIITDQAIEIGGYRPDNADGQFAGDISIRQALVRSRNTTAVMLLDKLGIDTFLARFRSAGSPLRLPGSDSAAGLAVALGGVGVTLEQLTWFFTALANEGELKTLRVQASEPSQSLGQFISPAAARATADILADVPSPPGYARQRSADGGRRIAFKTGTSYGFRDAWAVGFDQLHTVGVWVGRPDGAAHLGAYGATVAAPILMQIFDRLPVPRRDVGAGRADLGPLTSLRELPKRLTRFNDFGRDGARHPLEISFPRNGADVHVDRSAGQTVELPLIVTGGKPPYQWTLSGALQPPDPLTVRRWATDGRGQMDINVIDATGTIATSSFWLE
jgi:penicillin-binding protein 1C